jgi:photosystem II stability/assembly factor-like uncharacterized protein
MSSVRPLCYILLLILGIAIGVGCNSEPVPTEGGPADSAANIVHIHHDSTRPFVVDDKQNKLAAITTPYTGGWIAANSLIFNSIDQGTTWQRQLAVFTPIHALTSNFKTFTIAVGEYGLILYSTNSGFTWDTAVVHGDKQTALRAVDNGNGNSNGSFVLAVGDDATIVRSINAGVSWDTLSIQPPHMPALLGVCITDPTTAIVVGDRGTILRTHDGGDNWSQITSPGLTTDYKFYGVAAANSNNVMVVGDRSAAGVGTAFLSTDGGNTWSDRSPPALAQAHLKCVSFGPASWWVAGSDANAAALWKTTDNGVTWHKVPIRYGMAELLAIKMTGDDEGFAVGQPVIY